ncbi:MAG: hypothetical protein NTY02_15865 [Acidobacteria bacterium]|nr:hypothetical protein [Acidobacteriota bacterium]
MSDDEKKPFDVFELCVAVLLGLSAIGAALAGVQNGQWGGKMLENFSVANTTTTRAAKEYNEAVSNINSDYAAVAQAKRSILDGIYAKSADEKEKDFQTASYYLTQQLSEDAYEALGLPKDKYEPDVPGAKKTTTEAEVEEDLKDVLPEEALLVALDTELHDDDSYSNGMFETAEKQLNEAEAKFAEGRAANETGDKYSLTTVYFTIALFFAGLGLVFKTRMRWVFFSLGAVTFIGAAGYMLTLPWAS